jgi:protein phosphatase
MVQDDEILKIVTNAADIREACTNLIARANEHGGEDNITAVLIKIEEHVDAPTEEIAAVGGGRKGGGAAGAAGAATASGTAASSEDLGTEEPTAPGIVPPAPAGRGKPPPS